MNTVNTNQKLAFLALASSLFILKSSNDFMSKVNATDGINLEDIKSQLVFDEENYYSNSLNSEEVFKQAEEYRLYLKKLEEEERERQRLESLKTYIYIDTNDLTVLSDIKVEELAMLLKDTNLEHLAQDYLDAQEIYGVSALFLAALTANESGWGYSELAITKNNLSGFAAYPGQEHNARSFSSKRECIMETARLLSQHYLNPEGKYHRGYSLEDVNINYCQFADGSANYKWSNAIGQIMAKFASELKSITEELKEDVDAVSYIYFNGVEQY